MAADVKLPILPDMKNGQTVNVLSFRPTSIEGLDYYIVDLSLGTMDEGETENSPRMGFVPCEDLEVHASADQAGARAASDAKSGAVSRCFKQFPIVSGIPFCCF
jgi:hypothetical protein